MHKSTHTGARRAVTLDGLRVHIIDAPAPSGAELERAMRTLARMMVKAHSDDGAIAGERAPSSPLTPGPIPRTHHTDEAA